MVRGKTVAATILTAFLLMEVGLMAQTHRHVVDVNAMVRVLCTGDSQSCGRNLAIDYPQLLSQRLPVRMINTAVGGSNSSAQLYPMKSGTVRVKKGEKMVYGTKVRWGMGPIPGCKVMVNGQRYTIDYIVEHAGKPETELGVVEPIVADYEGPECWIEPCWEDRVAKFKPDVVSVMYINDGAMTGKKPDDWREMIARIRKLGAVPILMSPYPVDDKVKGGNHPGDNKKVAQNAAAVRKLAEEENCWFVDNFNLNLALDPALRGMVRDGIHPDTDGQQVTIDGLMWVYQQMGITRARPSFESWVLTGTGNPEADAYERDVARPFRTAQPDHPDADHQKTEGFTIDAFHRCDEYTVISAVDDDYTLVVGHGVKLRIGFAAEKPVVNVAADIVGTNLESAQVWLPNKLGWADTLLAKTAGGWRVSVPAEALSENVFTVILRGGKGASIDYVAATADAAGPPQKWRPSEREPSPYDVVSEHARKDNLIADAAFTADETAWKLQGEAWINRPYTADVGAVSFTADKARRRVELAMSGKARGFDLLTVSGSTQKNDGNYRIMTELAAGVFQTRKRNKAVETGLKATLTHNDGCGLVEGGSCVEVPSGGTAKQTVALPADHARLRVSLFHRAFEPKSRGTRDVPRQSTLVLARFLDVRGMAIGAGTIALEADASYQWRKLDDMLEVPATAVRLELSLRARSSTGQFTGIYVGPAAH